MTLADAANVAGGTGLTPAGWTFMLVSIAAVLSLAIFCYARVLCYDPEAADHMQAPLDIDTRDKGT